MEPQPQSAFSLRNILLWTFLLGAGIAVGAIVSYRYGFNAAKAMVAKSNFGAMYIMPEDVRTMSGTVTTIGDNQVTLHFTSLDPFADRSLDDRIVRIDASSIITSSVEPELPSSMGNVANSSTSTVAVLPPARPAAVSFSSIKIGDALSVTANENIKSAKEFVAKEIQIQSSARAQ